MACITFHRFKRRDRAAFRTSNVRQVGNRLKTSCSRGDVERPTAGYEREPPHADSRLLSKPVDIGAVADVADERLVNELHEQSGQPLYLCLGCIVGEELDRASPRAIRQRLVTAHRVPCAMNDARILADLSDAPACSGTTSATVCGCSLRLRRNIARRIPFTISVTISAPSLSLDRPDSRASRGGGLVTRLLRRSERNLFFCDVVEHRQRPMNVRRRWRDRTQRAEVVEPMLVPMRIHLPNLVRRELLTAIRTDDGRRCALCAPILPIHHDPGAVPAA